MKKTIIDRANNPTPPFFKKLIKIGIGLAAVGTAIVTAPVALPAAIVTVGSYLITAGAVAAAVSKVVDESPCE